MAVDDRYAAVDVHYPDPGGARAARVIATDRQFTTIVEERVAWLDQAAPYESGNFFARELPPIRTVLTGVEDLTMLFIDGYVDLDPDGRPGLGAHLRDDITIPIIGVAKTAFRSATHAVEVRRGTATRPLYITASGLSREEAAVLVGEMSGPHRLPDALRRVDALARSRA
jgi:deoxyribonuclease V